ncbi:MAG: RNA-binding domain-containing protein [Chloroflexota bacterium]
MTDWQTLIRSGESQTIEFKKSTKLLREATESICAFANQRGGYLFFGITDDGNIVGQQVSEDTLKNIVNTIKLNTDPKLYPTVEKIEIEGKSCIAVSIEESPLKPHLAYGRPYLRVGPTNQRLDQVHYEQMLMQRLNGYGFDYQTQADATIDDIHMESLHTFLETANAVRNLNENLLFPADMILQKLDLMTNKGITNAALLLFGKNPQKFFSHRYEIKCGHFNDELGYDVITNYHEYSDTLIDNYHKTFAFLVGSLRQTFTKPTQQIAGIDNTQHKKINEYPHPVLREAIVNMIVHRDYRQDIKSTVEVRPQHISFYNPGHLFEPTITIERLYQMHPSRPGNKLIAKIFYQMGLFENWGSGTQKIVYASQQAGKPTPKFSFEGGMFRLLLFRN